MSVVASQKLLLYIGKISEHYTHPLCDAIAWKGFDENRSQEEETLDTRGMDSNVVGYVPYENRNVDSLLSDEPL